MKEKISFDRMFINNRWKRKTYSRNCDWVMIGIAKNWSGPNDFCYKLCLFGIDLCFWFKREFIRP